MNILYAALLLENDDIKKIARNVIGYFGFYNILY